MGRAGGRLGIAAAGAVIGSYVPGVGASLGWIVGSIIGALVLPDKNNQRGPRLGDLQVTTSAYGQPVPRGYGVFRMGGNVTWIEAGQIKEVKNSRTVGKGGGSKVTNFEYYASFAIDFGEGPAADVLRIWADSKLIYDKRSAVDHISEEGLAFRFYEGTEDQLPDPLEVADLGEDNVPGYRGHVRIVFDNLPLANFGNRIPSISAEIAYETTDTLPVDEAEAISGGTLTTVNNTFFAVDWERGYAYVVDSSPVNDAALTGLRRINLNTMKEDRQITSEDSLEQLVNTSTFAAVPACVLPVSGRIVCKIDTITGTNAEPIVSLDQVTLIELGRFGAVGSSLVFSPTSWGPVTHFDAVALVGPLGVEEYVIAKGTNAVFGILFVGLDGTINYVWDSKTFLPTVTINSVRSVCGGLQAEGFAEVYAITGNSYTLASSDSLRVWRITIKAGAMYSLLAGQNVTTGIKAEVVADYTPSDLVPGETNLRTAGLGMVYDETDDSLIFHVRGDSDQQNYLVKIDPDNPSTPLWLTAVNSAPNDGSGWPQSRIQNDTYGFFAGADGTLVDTRTGELLVDDETYSVGTATGSAGAYDSRREAWVGLTGSASTLVAKWYFRRVQGVPANLADIITDLVEATGLTSSDIDVSDLTDDEVPGYVVSSVASAREAIQPLATAYFFDGVESDFIIKFVERGGSSVRTITQDELGRVEGSDEYLPENRVAEIELPERIILLYADQDNDYQQGSASSKRLLAPTPAMYSRDELSIEIAAAFVAEFAKQFTEKALITSWIERVSYNTTLGWKHVDLDPTDVLTLTLDNGDQFRVRMIQTEVDVGFAAAVKMVLEEVGQYASSVAADGGQGPLGQEIPAAGATKLIILDVPLLRDEDEPSGRSFVQMYFFMGGYGQPGWHAGVLFKSSEGSSYTEIGRIVNEMTWGSTFNALGDPPDDNPFATDEVNELTVALATTADTLESVTYLEMLNGANAAALVKSNGEIEVIQFQDVVDNGDGTVTLSTLLRGRRGTDTMSFDHTPGETFVYLDALDGDRFPLTLGEVSASRYYKGVGDNQRFDDAPVQVQASEGRALQPYAPVQIEATLVGGNDIDLEWVRRTRVGGDLIDGAGTVPLNEDTEEYEIDIYDTLGGSVVRTVTGLSSPATTYTSAQQATDGFSPPLSQLVVAVYQVSAQVGRGFARPQTIDVV